MNQSINQPMNQTMNLPMNQPMNQSINQSMNQSIPHRTFTLPFSTADVMLASFDRRGRPLAVCAHILPHAMFAWLHVRRDAILSAPNTLKH